MRLLLPLLLAMAAAACGERGGPAPTGRAAPGEPMPAYAAPDLAGDTVSLAGLKGVPVVLNVWATWCPPCREEMPSLQRLHERFSPEGVRVVAVSIDNAGAADAVRAFVADYGITFTILHDPDETISRVLRTIGVPETYLVGRDGRLIRRWLGKVDADSEEFRNEVRAALDGQRPRAQEHAATP